MVSVRLAKAIAVAQLACNSVLVATSAVKSAASSVAIKSARSVAVDIADEITSGMDEFVPSIDANEVRLRDDVEGDVEGDARSMHSRFDELDGRVKGVSPYIDAKRQSYQLQLQEQRERGREMYEELVEENAQTEMGIRDLDKRLRKMRRGNLALMQRVRHVRGDVSRLRTSFKRLGRNLSLAMEFGANAKRPADIKLEDKELHVLQELHEADVASQERQDHVRRVQDIVDWQPEPDFSLLGDSSPSLPSPDDTDTGSKELSLIEVSPADGIRSYQDSLREMNQLRRKVHTVEEEAKASVVGLNARIHKALHAQTRHAGELLARRKAFEKQFAEATKAREVLEDAFIVLKKERQELFDSKVSAAQYMAKVGRQGLDK